jgi:DNA-binding transcriptional regulator GbsR (MarR family)
MIMTSHRPATTHRRKSAADLRNNRKEFVERLAVAHEADGLCRIAGRIFGLLLLCEREMSLDEITSELGASKGSASVNTRLLEQRGIVERVSKPGDRRDYYRIMPNLFERTMEQRLARWQRFHEIVTHGLAELELSPAVRNRLMDFEMQQENIRDVIETALEKWRSRRKR